MLLHLGDENTKSKKNFSRSSCEIIQPSIRTISISPIQSNINIKQLRHKHSLTMILKKIKTLFTL